MKDVESWGKRFSFPRSAFCSQQSNHHIGSTSEEGLHLSFYDLSLERSHTITSLSMSPSKEPPLAPSTGVSAPSKAGMAMPNWQESSHTTLVVGHSVARLSISLSQMMLINLPIVQVPTTKGTLRLKSDSSGTTRNTVSSCIHEVVAVIRRVYLDRG